MFCCASDENLSAFLELERITSDDSHRNQTIPKRLKGFQGARRRACNQLRRLGPRKAILARYSATMRCNSRRTKLERPRSCLAAISSIASKISLGTLLTVRI